MKVKAIQIGYYNHCRKYPGEVFDLVDAKHFSKAWMIDAAKKVPEVKEVEAPKGKGKFKAVEAVSEEVI